MPRSTDAQLDALKKRKGQIEAQISALNARRQKEAKRIDTRRKVVAGAILLEHCEHDASFKDLVASLLNRFLTRDVDRALFAEDFGWPMPARAPGQKAPDTLNSTVKPKGGDQPHEPAPQPDRPGPDSNAAGDADR